MFNLAETIVAFQRKAAAAHRVAALIGTDADAIHYQRLAAAWAAIAWALLIELVNQ